MAVEGYLIIADISGYTSFLMNNPLEHAQPIMEELTKLILRHVAAPARLVKLEGDAVFYWVPADAVASTERIIESVESCYFDFRSHLQDMQRATTCQCNACVSMHSLDLKFFAHYGRFAVHKLAGQEDLAGPDVILLHRLLKNTVAETLGTRAYLLATEAMLRKLGRELGWPGHVESYEHLGEVPCRVSDLRAAYQAWCERRRIKAQPGTTGVRMEEVFDATPAQLWDWWADPAKNHRWHPHLTSLKGVLKDSARTGVGTEVHCAHGEAVQVMHYVDWRPYEYLTFDSPGKGMSTPPTRFTAELVEEEPGKTRVIQSMELLPCSLGQRVMFAVMKVMLPPVLRKCMKLLHGYLAEENARAAALSDGEPASSTVRVAASA